jgi:hypothetical protein
MKKVTSALIFPETEPSIHGVAKLLIFFTALSYYLPTETDGAINRSSIFFTNLCAGYAPAPLGDDLSRFKRLLREMETSRPDELSRLFSTAKAPMAAGHARDQDETSAAGVYSALSKDAEIKTSTRYKERLWQARLILKLAEMLDRREMEVRQGLAQVSSVEQQVFASLTGFGETEMADLTELNGLDKLQRQKSKDNLPHESSLETSGMLISLRLKAWAELYLADSSDLHTLILASANAESGAILLDSYENTWRRDPKILFSLSIPAVNPADIEGAWDQYLASRNAFRATVHENIEYFARFLQETATSAELPPHNREEISLLTKNVSAWEEKVQVHFPDPETRFKKLVFYCFPGISFAELFQRLYHVDGPIPANNKQQRPTALLAILKS